MDSNNSTLHSIKKPVVYVAFCGCESKTTDVIGVFSDKYTAVDRCLKEPTYTRQGWTKVPNTSCYWTNGHGRYVKVAEYLVE